MDIHFGRIQEKNGKPTIKSIDQNKQSEDGPIILYEEEARQGVFDVKPGMYDGVARVVNLRVEQVYGKHADASCHVNPFKTFHVVCHAA